MRRLIAACGAMVEAERHASWGKGLSRRLRPPNPPSQPPARRRPPKSLHDASCAGEYIRSSSTDETEAAFRYHTNEASPQTGERRREQGERSEQGGSFRSPFSLLLSPACRDAFGQDQNLIC